MQHTFKSMPDRASHLTFFHEHRDWTAIKHFWSALISRNRINCTPVEKDQIGGDVTIAAATSTPSVGAGAGAEVLKSSQTVALPHWVRGMVSSYGVTDIQAIHECGAEEFLGYHARGDKKKGNKRKTFALR